MDIKYAILGLLDRQPYSGYDLKKMISESDLFYWSGNNNQIYNSLIQLHKDGLVSQQVQVQENLPAKKIYTITERGRVELGRWLLSDPELPEFHDPFLIQLALMNALTGEQVDNLLGKYANEIEIQLRMRQAQASREDAAAGRTERERFLWKKISENLIGRYQAELEWVTQLRETLKEKQFNDLEEE